MNEQKAIILSVAPLGTYPTRDGATMHKFGITYQGSQTQYEYHTSKVPQTDFVQGQEATFITEVKVNGNYTNYRIKPVKTQVSSGGGGGFKKGFSGGNAKTPEQNRLASIQSIFASVCNLGQGKATVDQAWTKTEEIYDKAMKLAYKPHPVEGTQDVAQPVQQHPQQPVTPNPINPTPIQGDESDIPF